MRANILKSGLVLGVAAVALAPANAQSADQPEARQETVVVTGTPIRDSQAAAIEAKRNAPNVSDIISADTIGRFPDQNLADSLGRIPGLAIERDQGQARFINFRGAPFRYTSIAFDGVQVPGADNGRIPRFDSFPSVITSAVTANKAVTADMPGESIAGFIDISTFNPFDQEGLAISAEVGYGEQELGGGPVQKYNARLSYSGDKFGALVFGSTNSRDQVTDNRELGLAFTETGPVVEDLDFRSYFVDREDNALGTTLEFRPGGAVERVFFSSLFTEFVDQEERNQYVFEFSDFEGEPLPVAPSGSGTTLFVATFLGEDGQYDNSTFTNTLGADFNVGGWALEGRLNYTETENNTFLPIPQSVGAAALGTYDLSDLEQPVLTLSSFEGAPLTAADLEFALDIGIIFASELNNEQMQGKLDAERDISLLGRDAVLKVGGLFDTREADGVGQALAVDFPLSTSGLSTAGFLTDTLWYSDFNNTIGGTYFRNDEFLSAWSQDRGGFGIDVDPDQLIGIEEDIFAGYGMVTLDYDWGNLIVGARVESTDFSTSGSILNDDDTVTAVSRGNDYVNVLPSAHVNIDLQDDLKLRLSATSGISRPTYNEARASVTVSPTETPPTASGGNPDLDPEEAYGLDASLEYYFADASLFAVGAFARLIDNVIYADTQVIADGSSLAPGLIDPGTPVQFTSSFNGENGELYGLEVNFIGQAGDFIPALEGFGASGNLTMLDSEFETLRGDTLSLPGTSDLIYNASVFYENFGLSARLNYQYRDAWLSETESTGGGEFWDEQQRLDASVRYLVPTDFGGAQFTLFANANNLTDERDVRFEQRPGTIAVPNQIEGYGRRYLIGVRVDY